MSSVGGRVGRGLLLVLVRIHVRRIVSIIRSVCEMEKWAEEGRVYRRRHCIYFGMAN